jgi:hypothetical protein
MGTTHSSSSDLLDRFLFSESAHRFSELVTLFVVRKFKGARLRNESGYLPPATYQRNYYERSDVPRCLNRSAQRLTRAKHARFPRRRSAYGMIGNPESPERLSAYYPYVPRHLRLPQVPFDEK